MRRSRCLRIAVVSSAYEYVRPAVVSFQDISTAGAAVAAAAAAAAVAATAAAAAVVAI